MKVNEIVYKNINVISFFSIISLILLVIIDNFLLVLLLFSQIYDNVNKSKNFFNYFALKSLKRNERERNNFRSTLCVHNPQE